MVKRKYSWIRIESEAKKNLDERLKKINKIDLPKIGFKHGEIKQIDLTKYLFKNKIFISDKDLIGLATKKRKRKC